MKKAHAFLHFLKQPSTRGLLLFLAVASALILSAALVAQYGFGLYPCTLCIYQRYPYLLVLIIGVAAGLLPASERLRRLCVLFCAGLLIVGAGIALYHTGVELEWFTGPDACASKASPGASLEDLRKEIMTAPLVSCSQAMGYVFGLSLAAWNAIISSLLAVYVLAALIRIRRQTV